jgi:DNA-binding NtrC family response regulator
LQEALSRLASDGGKQPSAIILDHDFAGDRACQYVEELKRQRADLPVLLLTTDTSPSLAVEAIRAGASDLLQWPVKADRLLHALRLAVDPASSGELRLMVEKFGAQPDFDAMIGVAPAFRAALARAAKAARGPGNILVEGEGGTGKDTLIKAIHASSPRARMSHKFLNVRSVSSDALASELFGHEKAAPGVSARHIGLIEQCEGGTLILDEVNRLPPAVQKSLAETLARARVRPIGALYSVRMNVRIIAASNQPLRQMVEQGAFDAGLHELLSGTCISLPPLRDRAGDIPALARHFLREITRSHGLRDLGITEPAILLLSAFKWPGNIRQLQNVLFRAALLCEGDALTVDNFPSLLTTMGEEPNSDRRSELPDQGGVMIYAADGNLRPLAEIEADVIRLAVGHYRGRLSLVARQLGIGRSTLYRKLGQLGIEAA